MCFISRYVYVLEGQTTHADECARGLKKLFFCSFQSLFRLIKIYLQPVCENKQVTQRKRYYTEQFSLAQFPPWRVVGLLFILIIGIARRSEICLLLSSFPFYNNRVQAQGYNFHSTLTGKIVSSSEQVIICIKLL